jgi:MYXO-CTERM domain-containing protein
MGRHAGLFALGLCLSGIGFSPIGHAQTVILYENDFEKPNVPLMVDCGNSLDTRGINFLYGEKDFEFAQDFTVEAVFLHDPAGKYKNAGDHGDYALGMLSTVQDDKLALAFDSRGYSFINIGIDLSSIDVEGCAGPFGVSAPKLRITLLDRPDGVVDYAQTELATQDVVGVAAADAWSFRWKKEVVGLSTEGTKDGKVTVVFDLLEGGYAVFDNLSITASMASKVVDLDLDHVADDIDNCPHAANADQKDTDRDGAGDVCDPAVEDRKECGDRDRNGRDDCSGAVVAIPDAGIDLPPAPPRRDAGVTEPLDASTEDASMPEAGSGAQAGRGGSSAGSGGRGGSSGSKPPTKTAESSGCGCSVPGTSQTGSSGAFLSLGAAALLWLVRRRARQSR